MSPLKRLELFGRRFLTWLAASVLAAPRRRVELHAAPRILVVRLDERVGNLVLLTPLLTTLTTRFPGAHVEVLGYAKTRALLANHPSVKEVHAFDKRSLFSSHGPLGIFGFLRGRAYDLAIDAANPTDPSFTQAVITRFAGARYSVGPAHGAFEQFYTSPVVITNEGHEIDLRLQLARDLPGGPTLIRVPTLGSQGEPSTTVRQFVEALPPFVVINLGARIKEKWLSPETYAEFAEAVMKRGFACVLTWGPVEHELATQTLERTPSAKLAPPTSLADLAYILKSAKAVVTCDTGPMHIAVAVGTPTCAIFVSTPLERYGYNDAPHMAVNYRDAGWREPVLTWLNGLQASNEPPAIKDEDEAHPVAGAWRATICAVVHRFAQGDFKLAGGVDDVEPVADEVAQQIQDYVSAYGATLIDLPAAAWVTSVAQWYGAHWDVVIDLWTAEEGRSDLVLEGRFVESESGPRFTVHMVRVP